MSKQRAQDILEYLRQTGQGFVVVRGVEAVISVEDCLEVLAGE